jgi:hypothetical protein
MPIVSRGTDDLRLEGTAFVLATKQGPRAVTAAHVLRGMDPDRPAMLGMALSTESAQGHRAFMELIPIKKLHWHKRIDVGWIEAELPRPTISLPIATAGVFFNSDVFCWDYSPARQEHGADGSRAIFADSWAHRGNVVRNYFEGDIEHLNVSFPTMQGASGSPVMVWIDGTLSVAGMVVGNLEQQFAPSILAQRVSVKDGDQFSESVSYFLPYGRALSARELIKGLSEFFEPLTIEPRG